MNALCIAEPIGAGSCIQFFLNYIAQRCSPQEYLEVIEEPGGEVILRSGEKIISKNPAADKNAELVRLIAWFWNGQIE